jgi:sugar phosphate isomerase/epimerase
MKIGLYSITYLGVWYRGDALALEQVIERARVYGYEGVEIDGKRPHGNPLDMPRSRCQEIRKRAAGRGIDIYAVAANNDFSSPIPEQRESQLVYVRDLIRMTADLGAKVLRVFAAWPGVTRGEDAGRYDIARFIWQTAHADFSPQQTWAWCRDALAEASRMAGDEGVTLALQNHPPVIENYRDLLRMIKEVDSPHLKACLDAPLLHSQGEVSMREPALATGSLQVLSHFGGEYEQSPYGVRGFVRERDARLTPERFYREFVDAMAGIGYTGYLGYELCHPLPKVAGRTVGIDFADKNARLAAEYMHGLVTGIRKVRAAA